MLTSAEFFRTPGKREGVDFDPFNRRKQTLCQTRDRYTYRVPVCTETICRDGCSECKVRNMTNRLQLGVIVAFLSLIAPGLSFAQIHDRERVFKILCIGDQSSGFDWVNKTWVPTRFKPEQYLIEKMNIDDKTTPFCAAGIGRNKPLWTDSYGLVDGCYNVHVFGRVSYPRLAQVCLEEWKKLDGKWSLRSISCRDQEYIHLKPDGAFTQTNWNETLDDDAAQKDSLSLTVGRCNVM